MWCFNFLIWRELIGFSNEFLKIFRLHVSVLNLIIINNYEMYSN